MDFLWQKLGQFFISSNLETFDLKKIEFLELQPRNILRMAVSYRRKIIFPFPGERPFSIQEPILVKHLDIECQQRQQHVSKQLCKLGSSLHQSQHFLPNKEQLRQTKGWKGQDAYFFPIRFQRLLRWQRKSQMKYILLGQYRRSSG